MSTTTTKRRPLKKATKANPAKRPASDLTEDELLIAVAEKRKKHGKYFPIEKLFREFGYELEPKVRNSNKA